jgi:hypothetical protein
MSDLNETLLPKIIPKDSEILSGSGSEVDRLESHFGLGEDGIARVKRMAEMEGTGAEQDRYGGHFGIDEQKIKDAAAALSERKGSGAEQDVHAARFELGNDGIQQVRKLVGAQGVGSEQVGVK